MLAETFRSTALSEACRFETAGSKCRASVCGKVVQGFRFSIYMGAARTQSTLGNRARQAREASQ